MKYPNIAQAIAHLIEEHGTMRGAARVLHTSATSIELWLRGDRAPTYDMLKNIARAYGKSIAWLMASQDDTTETDLLYDMILELTEEQRRQVYKYIEGMRTQGVPHIGR